jgi:tRNA/tmRNA/rRNA uracil-C5-methylase (TrmA/RlmC/RlmD family)
MPVTVSVRGVPGAFHLTADSFWQVHPGAADALVEAVLDGVGVHAGESVLDLYCGAGLFAGALAARGATVTGVEANTSAVDLARRNVPGGRFIAGDVSRCLPGLGEADVVVLDPPRAGAGRDVMRAVLNVAPRVIAYVACDPAALARDLSETTGRYEPVSIRAFDLFPQTHHFECVALLTKSGSDPTDASRPRAL